MWRGAAVALILRQAESRHTSQAYYYQSATNLNHFYPVAERNGKPLSKSRWTGFGSEQPEFVARNMATLKSVRTKSKE